MAVGKPLRSDHEVWNQMAGYSRKASKCTTKRIGCAMKCWDHLKAFGYRVRSAMLVFHTCTWTCIRELTWTNDVKVSSNENEY